MANINECLIKIQKLTQQNLEILQGINDSFTTNKDHLTVNVNGQSFILPSFISLENKLNIIQENFENLINAPETSEAYFSMDGNSRSIEVRKYNAAPNSLSLDTVETFDVESSKIFRDLLTPKPYIHLNLQSIPNDITKVNVKKIVAKSSNIENSFGDLLGDNVSVKVKYADIYKKVAYSQNDIDEYDTVMSLPIRKNIGTGVYTISEIISDSIGENLVESITLRVNENLVYTTFNETISKSLNVGDELTNIDGTTKFKIASISPNTKTLTIDVVNGEYSNLAVGDKLKFFAAINFDEDKYIHIPLEEDRYVFIAIAPLNDRMNLQASWGEGVLLDTYKLKKSDGETLFNEYYKNNVTNIGDILNELVISGPGALTNLSQEDFETLKTAKPSASDIHTKVVKINSHLEENTVITNIKNLYAQKKKLQTELNNINDNINSISTQLANISFNDTTNLRSAYTAQLSSLGQDKAKITAALMSTIDEISIAANNTELPIENAKYHIRGYIDIKDALGMIVEYKYVNANETTTKDDVINDKPYSSWNRLYNTLNLPHITRDSNGSYKTELNSSDNIETYNNIDIPISQGEKVVLRYKLIYKYGYPYSQLTSAFSDEYVVEFPQDFVQDIEIADIISENNSDAETYKLDNILSEKGITSHIGNSIVDQDITYFHQPENIASGYYTAERRIIPLKDKLEELTNTLTLLRDEVMGTASSNIDVSIGIGDKITPIQQLQNNNIYVEPYSNFQGQNTISGAYVVEGNNVSVNINIMLTNNSSHILKLYPLFPGSKDVNLRDLQNYKYDISEYTLSNVVNYVDINYVQNSWEVDGEDNVDYGTEGNTPLQGALISEDEIGFYLTCNGTKCRISGDNRVDIQGYNTRFKIERANPKSGYVYFSVPSKPRQDSEVILQKLVLYKTSNYYTPFSELLTAEENIYKISNSGTIYAQGEKTPIAVTNVSQNLDLYINYKNETSTAWKPQSANQFITFRVRDAYDGSLLYTDKVDNDELNQALSENIKIMGDRHSILYPQITDKYSLDCGSGDAISYIIINPNETIIVPLVFVYDLSQANSTSKPFSFDLRTSLYKDPITYKFTVTAKKTASIQDQLQSINQQYNTSTKYNTTVIK